ncbi:hypothetical protein ABPG75_002614 [Micractinium tetrahymenae]
MSPSCFKVMVMIHTGSRGLGHQVCTDALGAADRAMGRARIKLVDRQLACMPVSSPEGQHYLGPLGPPPTLPLESKGAECLGHALAQLLGAYQWRSACCSCEDGGDELCAPRLQRAVWKVST